MQKKKKPLLRNWEVVALNLVAPHLTTESLTLSLIHAFIHPISEHTVSTNCIPAAMMHTGDNTREERHLRSQCPTSA